jgi:hypothetical protein
MTSWQAAFGGSKDAIESIQVIYVYESATYVILQI